MIRINFTCDVVELEPLDVDEGDEDLLMLVATATTPIGGNDHVQHQFAATGEWDDIPIAAGARSTGGLVYRERQATQPGKYQIRSAVRNGKESHRNFDLSIEHTGGRNLKLTIEPGSTPAFWIMGNFDPVKTGADRTTIHIENGQVTSIDTGKPNDQRRPTAWEKMDDDDI
jgi:hypothetical protein